MPKYYMFLHPACKYMSNLWPPCISKSLPKPIFSPTITSISLINKKLKNPLSILNYPKPITKMNDKVDKLVIFLAKRDGIDKLVKTFQYVSKLVHWHIQKTHPDYADRAREWEVALGLSRKAFRSGRFLTGFNALRRSPGSTTTFRLLAVLSNAGEMVYFFDHFLWLSRIGVLDAKLAKRMSFISAFGESVGYIFFMISDFLIISDGIRRVRMIVETGVDISKDAKEHVKIIRGDRVRRLMVVAANLADLIIVVADIEPNPFCNHVGTLGISGLVGTEIGHHRVGVLGRNW